MSRELTFAEKAILSALAKETPSALRAIVDQLVPPKHMVSTGATIATTGSVTNTSVTIPAAYQVGEKYDLGMYLGQFDLGKGVGEKPIFLVKLTNSMEFEQTVEITGELENGYKANYHTYDAYDGLRKGKTVIAPFDIVWAAYIVWEAYKSKDEGQLEKKSKNVLEKMFKNVLEKMFKNVGWVSSSSPRPDYPNGLRIVDFRGGGAGWLNIGLNRAPSLLVRTAVNHLTL